MGIADFLVSSMVFFKKKGIKWSEYTVKMATFILMGK